MLYSHPFFAVMQPGATHRLYPFLPENMQHFLASPLVDLGSLLALGIAVVLLFVLNQRKKHLITSTSKMLEETEGHYQLLFRHSPLPLMVGNYSGVKKILDTLSSSDRADLAQHFSQDPAGLDRCAAQVQILDANRAALRTYKVGKPEQISRLLTTMPDEAQDPFLQELCQLLQYGTSEIQVHNRASSGETLTLLRRTVVTTEAEKSWERVFVALIDITEALRLRKENQDFERQLQENKKLQALGSMSGGIAHDFSNILSPILSHSEMLLLKDTEPALVRKHAQAITSAAVRAQKLIRQILTFSRQVGQEFRPLSLNSIIGEVINLIEPTLSKNIKLSYFPNQKQALILADATQLHQVLMNLLTNALHAMEAHGGSLTLRLDLLDADEAQKTGCKAQEKTYFWQRLRIEDTGHGMDEATKAKIFDQYFTTKPCDQGTGLGLPMTLDILRGCGGEIQVQSVSGHGSIFTLYFPVIDTGSVEEEGYSVEPAALPLPQGREHILLVDDEQSIAEVMAAMLVCLGYQVTIRTNPQEALQLFAEQKDSFDLLLVDLDMPQVNGLQFCQKVHELQADAKAIICTGFIDQKIEEAFRAMGIATFIQKPVLIAELSCRIRSVLD